mgnify:CR=1 FL=1
MKKRLISVLLLVCMIAALFPGMALSAAAVDAEAEAEVVEATEAAAVETNDTAEPEAAEIETAAVTEAAQPEAEGYKFSGTITIIVPFNAGSNTDSQLRFFQKYLEKHLGTNTIVVNKGGASGVIGTTEFLTYEPDGNTILFSLPTPTVYKPAGGDTEYTLDDLIPVAAGDAGV